MKNIIVAMDFSKGADHALEYAITIANTTISNILMVWVDTFQTKEMALGMCKNEIRRDAKIDLQQIVKDKSSMLTGGTLKFKMRKGKVYQELALQAKSSESFLIVVGTHGISGFEEFWIGSNAFKIISYAPCPVISVRVDYDITKPIKTIVLPIDNSLNSTNKVPMAVKLANAFNADIHLLAIYTTNLASLRKKVDRSLIEAEKYLLKEGVNFVKNVTQTNNLPVTVADYSKTVNGDLIVIMTDQDKANLSILMGDYSHKILNLSLQPILSVKPENLFN